VDVALAIDASGADADVTPMHPSVPDPIDRRSLLLVGAGLVALSVVAFVRQASPEWSRIQDDVRAEAQARLGAEKAARLGTGIQQVWIERLARVDRCTTCHTAIEAGPSMLASSNPAKSHPRPELLAHHPVEKFGCTLCHGGQGTAITKQEAHGEGAFWDDPLLSNARAKRYGLTAADLIESRCATCHRKDVATEGTPRINDARALAKSKRCISCHRIEGRGGVAGPELTYEGDKNPEHLHFPKGWVGPRTALAWNVAHLKNPPEIVPGTEMTVFHFTDEQATSLALLVASWRRQMLPPEWLPAAKAK
jgi:cytochrome c2